MSGKDDPKTLLTHSPDFNEKLHLLGQGIKAYHSMKEKAEGFPYLFLELFKSCSELIVIFILLFASVLLLSSGTYNPFIYFRF